MHPNCCCCTSCHNRAVAISDFLWTGVFVLGGGIVLLALIGAVYSVIKF